MPGGQPPWLVNNYDGNGEGRMNLADATVDSVNTVYAQLVMDVGMQARRRPRDEDGRPVAPRRRCRRPRSGSNGATVLDMASAYDTLAGDGMHTDPVFVTRVTTSDGTVLYRAPVRRTRALSETTARTITGVLQQVVTRGTGVNARIGRPVAGKTGTSDDWADAWFVGYTPELVTAVWVGFPPEGDQDAPADDADHGHRRVLAGADLAAASRVPRSPRPRSPSSPPPRRRPRPPRRRAPSDRGPTLLVDRGPARSPTRPARCATRATGCGSGRCRAGRSRPGR